MLVIYLIYAGGLSALPEKKIGFWRRVFWPVAIGEYLATLIWKGPPHD